MQTARGASLTPERDLSTTPDRRPARWLFVLVFAVGYATDVISKIVAVDKLTDRAPVEVIGTLLQLRLIRNPGAAFGTGTRFTVALSCLAIVACCVVLFYAARVVSRGWAVALGLLLAGIGGNLTDRLLRSPGPLRGHVVDFFALPNWPIFNVADICIDTAAALILIMVFRGIALDGTREGREDR